MQKGKRDYFKAAGIYLLLICTVYSPIVFYGKTLSMAARYPWFETSPPEAEWVLPVTYPNTFNVDIGSPATLEEPIDVFIGSQIRRGTFPLWNPFIACGTVIQEQFCTRSLFPYQLLQDVCPWQWRDFFLLGRLFFAAMGVFIFLKLLGLSFYPALCGGIMYAFSGAMTVFLTFTEMSNIGMVLPYALLGGELLNRRVGIHSVIFCSLATAFLILGGQPEVSFYGILLLFCYYFFRAVTTKERKRNTTKKMVFFFLSMILALLISSPFFVPFLVNSEQYYHLHPPGGTQGIETPTPLVNLIAIFLPELLRWRSPISAFTVSGGWDSLGGYIGVAGIFIILASLRRHWWGRKAYLFFLLFSLFILLKNLGIPIVSWVGRLPIFDQVWTPRWAGPAWNLSLVLSAALGFQALLLIWNKESSKNGNINFLKRKLCVFWWLIFLVLSFGIVLCVLNFQGQFRHIDGMRNFLKNVDNLVLFSMWQAKMESTVLGLTVLLALFIALKQRLIDGTKFAFVFSGIIVLEMSFHVTIGYSESVRLLRLFWHVVLLLCLILYVLFSKRKITDAKAKMGLCLFFIGMIAVGTMGAKCIPNRKDVFKRPYNINLNYNDFSRIMGIRGLVFPNTSAALGLQDIKSTVSLSIRRFQLFQDYCLSAVPQGKYKSLWFTGIMDPETGKDISDNLRERYHFYALAGISNYLSPHYEDIPYTKLIQDGSVKNYLNLVAMPRAFIVHKWFVAQSPEESLEWMLSHSSSLDSEVVVEGEEIPSVPDIEGGPFKKVKIKSYQLHSVVIEAETDFPGLLILTDAYHSDWDVTVDGKAEEIFPTDLCFRGVFLSPGKHEVRFTYLPRVFYICIAVSFITLLVLFMLGLKSLHTRK